MARRHVVELIDDLDGKVLDHGETVSFGLDGVDYAIDLSDRNAAKLRGVLAPYVAAGRAKSARRSGGRSGRGAVRKADAMVDTRAVRAWAAAHGIQVSSRGRRVPADVIAQFRAAGN
jgi:hypothetical protein